MTLLVLFWFGAVNNQSNTWFIPKPLEEAPRDCLPFAGF